MPVQCAEETGSRRRNARPAGRPKVVDVSLGATLAVLEKLSGGSAAGDSCELSTAAGEEQRPCERKKSPPIAALQPAGIDGRAALQALQLRLEECFTDANLAMDHFLHSKIREALPGGWVSCRALSQCHYSLESLAVNPRRALYALQSSHLETKLSGQSVELVDRVLVRRRQPLPPLLRKECQNPDHLLPADVRRMVLEDRFSTVNRLIDQRRVQAKLGLKEVGDSSTVFRERPDPKSGKAPEDGDIIATGYERVIYGDGGAYVEVNEDQICWESWPHFFDKRYLAAYYDEYYTETSHRKWSERWECWSNSTRGLLMLYAQVHPVSDRPWAPGAAALNPHAERAGGYADYRQGYYYFTADETLIVTEGSGFDSDTGHTGTNTASGDSASINEDSDSRSDSDATTPQSASNS